VTECVTGIDLVKAQIRIAAGAHIGTAESGVPRQEDIRVTSHALQCRVTTEDPENNFVPDYGRIEVYRSPAGIRHSTRCRNFAYAGAIITRFYDSLLVKVTAWSPTPEETIARMHRALWEFRIRGVVTNLRFLDQLIMHPRFLTADYTTKFIDQTPEFFHIPRKRDRATRLLSFIGDVIVNGNPEVKGRLCRNRRCFRGRRAWRCPGAAARDQAETWTNSDPTSLRSGCSHKSVCCSRIPACAMRISHCWPRASEPMTWR
jgi:pyruvate carboxylase